MALAPGASAGEITEENKTFVSLSALYDRDLLVHQRGNAGQFFPFQELERSTTAG